MRKPKILVTAAAGKTGAATALLLLAKGFPVRALVRREDDRSRRLKDAGAEIAVGSMEDWADLEAALKGVARAYFCPPLEPGTLRRATLFAAAAQEARLECVAVLSQWVADPLHPAVHAREKWLTGKVMEWLPGVGTVIINPGFFADNYMAVLETAAQFGLMALPLGEGLNAPPSNEDIARVVVGTLIDPAPHIGRSYRPTGPRLLSPHDMAGIIGKVLQRPVKYQDAPMKLFLKASTTLAIPDFVIEELSWFLLDYQRNAFGLGAPTAAVLEVGGAAPEDFETILRRYVWGSPVVARSIGARGRALATLMKALLARAPDPVAIARRLEIPPLSHARLAMDSNTWRQAHDPALLAPSRRPTVAPTPLPS